MKALQIIANEKLKKAIELIEKDGDAWIGLGDYVDCINHRDPRFNPQEISERYSIKDLEDLPRRQSDHFLSAIAPIKDRCLGLIYGNHEDYVYAYGAIRDLVYGIQVNQASAKISPRVQRNRRTVQQVSNRTHGNVA